MIKMRRVNDVKKAPRSSRTPNFAHYKRDARTFQRYLSVADAPRTSRWRFSGQQRTQLTARLLYNFYFQFANKTRQTAAHADVAAHADFGTASRENWPRPCPAASHESICNVACHSSNITSHLFQPLHLV